MSNAIAQSTNSMAVSGPGDLDLDALCRKVATRKAGGMTMAAVCLDNSKLFSAMASEFKSFNGLERTSRLPEETVERLQSAIDRFTADTLAQFNQNAVSCRTFAAHKASEQRFVKATVLRKEEVMSLKEQMLFCNIAINTAQKRLAKAEEEYKEETAAKVRKQIDKLMGTLANIQIGLGKNTA